MGVIEFFKKIIEVKDNDLSFLNVGDIIWARRYKTEEEKNKIKIGHQESPYVVIKKKKNKVYGLQCTSNPHQEVEWKMIYYPLGRLNYDMQKNSYINCLKEYELKEIQFVETIGKLNEYDLNQLKKQLYILINSQFLIKPSIEKKYLDYKIGIGDIILLNNYRYYIYSYDDKFLYTYRLRNRTRKNMNILINNTYYSFIFEHTEKIKIKSKYELVDTFNTGEIEVINEYKEKYLKDFEEKRQNGKELRIGAIIDYKDKMYYVYDEDDISLFVYQIYTNSISKPNLADIQIKGGIFRTFFATTTIKKENLELNGYKIRRCASEEEIEYNKKIFALPKWQRATERKKIFNASILSGKRNIDDFVPMTILKNENNKKYYLIIDRNENIIEVVNINNMGDTFYFELEKEHCPFKYYRILSKEEYDIYLSKIKELKEMIAMFDK